MNSKDFGQIDVSGNFFSLSYSIYLRGALTLTDKFISLYRKKFSLNFHKKKLFKKCTPLIALRYAYVIFIYTVFSLINGHSKGRAPLINGQIFFH